MINDLPSLSANLPTLPEAISKAIMHGDLKQLTPALKVQYYNWVCESMGLNSATVPFQYIDMKGKEVLYAGKNCAEQLRKIHNVSINGIQKEKIGDVFIVTVTAQLPNGRTDTSAAAVDLQGKKGEDLANQIMKAETKAKRRVTLSIVGLGMLDESEVLDNPQLFQPQSIQQVSTYGSATSSDYSVELDTGEVNEVADPPIAAPPKAEIKRSEDFCYDIPFKDEQARAFAKLQRLRFKSKKEGGDNCWHGQTEIPKLQHYLVGKPAPVEDDIPDTWFQDESEINI